MSQTPKVLLSLLIRLMTTSELNDSPKELDTEEDNRRHSVPIKIQMENKVNDFHNNGKLFHGSFEF